MGEISKERRALMWAFDRLSATCNCEKTNRRTAKEIGNVLLGRPSPAATYEPDEWADSSEFFRRPG